MGIEIERKFLVKSDGWRKLGCAVRYAQGYLCSDRNRTVRVRTVGDKGFLTIKGRGSGIAHPEYEYEIPYNEARTMLDELAKSPSSTKPARRFRLRASSGRWTNSSATTRASSWPRSSCHPWMLPSRSPSGSARR